MNKFEIIRPGDSASFADALFSLFARMGDYFRAEAAEGRKPVFLRFFLSDAQNQADALRKAEQLEGEIAHAREEGRA